MRASSSGDAADSAMWRWSAVEAVAALRAHRVTSQQLVEVAAGRLSAADAQLCNAVSESSMDGWME